MSVNGLIRRDLTDPIYLGHPGSLCMFLIYLQMFHLLWFICSSLSVFSDLATGVSLLIVVSVSFRFKSAQIPLIAAKSPSGSSVTLYRMADHIDITAGPLIANTNQIGRFNIVKVSFGENASMKVFRSTMPKVPMESVIWSKDVFVNNFVITYIFRSYLMDRCV